MNTRIADRSRNILIPTAIFTSFLSMLAVPVLNRSYLHTVSNSSIYCITFMLLSCWKNAYIFSLLPSDQSDFLKFFFIASCFLKPLIQCSYKFILYGNSVGFRTEPRFSLLKEAWNDKWTNVCNTCRLHLQHL